MSVIIRLQGLPWTASAMNIRHFFTGLNIPAGGVHIIGGEGGDAFIAFSSDEDARVAMRMNMSPLNGVPVQLYLSSKSEMQSVIEAARSGGPSTAQTTQNNVTPAAPANNMSVVGQASVAGINPMGIQTGETSMPTQPQQNMSGYPGMQGQGQTSMMGQKGNFPMMQQPHNMNSQGDGSSMAGGNFAGGMNVGNQWQQNYAGMEQQGQIQNQSQVPNMNMSQLQSNTDMMGGQGYNDQYSRFQNMQQQQQQQYHNRNEAFPGQGGALDRHGQEMMGNTKMDVQGQTSGMPGHNQNRFGDSAAMATSMGESGLNTHPGQYPVMKDNMNQGFMPGQRAGSLSQDSSMAMTAQIRSVSEGVVAEFPKAKYDINQMPPVDKSDATSNVGPWGADRKTEDNFHDKNQYHPDMNRDPMFRQGTGRDEGRRWPNRFEENSDPNRPYGIGMNRAESGPGFPERDSRMQGQFHGGFRNRHEQFPGHMPERTHGQMERGRGNQLEDGMPSTRYPPDDDVPMTESGRLIRGGSGLPDDSSRNIHGNRTHLSDNRKGIAEDKKSIPDLQKPIPEDKKDDLKTTPRERQPRQRVSRFDRDEKGVLIDQPPKAPVNEGRFPPEDKGFPGFKPDDRYGEFSTGNRFPSDRSFPDVDRRGRGDDDRKFPGEGTCEDRMGRLMHEDRMGRSMAEDRMGRPMAEDRMGRPIPEDRLGRLTPEDRMGRPVPEDRMGRPVPEDRMGRPMPGDRMGRPMPENRVDRPISEDRMGMPVPEDRMNRPMSEDRMGRHMTEEGMGRHMPEDRMSNHMPEDRMGRHMPEDRMGRRMPEDRIGRHMPEDRMGRHMSEDRMGRHMPEDRMGRHMPEDRMWPEDLMRSEEMRRKPGDNMFAPDDPRYLEREDELHREAYEFERGFDDRFMRGRGRGPMRGMMGRPGGDRFGMRPFPPDLREGDFLPEREGGFRGDDREHPYGSEGGYRDGPDRWNRFSRMHEKNKMEGGQRPGLLDTPEGMGMGGKDSKGGPLMDKTEERGGPFDMDQRYDKEMGAGGGRWPGMGGDDGFEYGRGRPMEEGFERGGPPRDFDNRAAGPRGRGGPMMDRGPRGRGEPFGRGGRGGMPPFGRGRGERGGEKAFDGLINQDVDIRKMDDRFPKLPDQQMMPDRPSPKHGGRGLLGDAPTAQDNSVKKEEPKADTKKDIDSRPPSRRSNDRDRDRRSYDDRRGRDDRDRFSYRDRYGRDRERDRERRRSRSRSRDRGSRDRDSSRYRSDNRDKSSREKSSKSSTDLTKSTRPTRFLSLKNMSKTLSYRDVRRFFQPMEIPFDGIKIINDKDGNRTGDAFVYFHRLDDAVKSQKKNGERVEGRSVTILFNTEDEFNKAVDSYVPNKKDSTGTSVPTSAPGKQEITTTMQQAGSSTSTTTGTTKRYIVQMKNLPLTITRQDINSFFKNLKIDNNGEAAYIEFDQSGVATGNGFVEFKTEVDYKQALSQNGTMLAKNKVNVLSGNPTDCDKLKAVQGEMFQRAALRNIANKTGMNNSGSRPNLPSRQQTPNQQHQQSPASLKSLIPSLENSNEDSSCVHIQGLPLLATPHDIREFFSESEIVTRGINIAHDGNGKPLGEGFVEFKSKPDFEKALKKDKTSLGRHIVAVKPIGKKEMVDRLQNARHRGGAPPKLPTSLSNPASSSHPPNPQGPPPNAQQISNIPFPKPPTSQNNSTPANQQSPQKQRQQVAQPPNQQQPPPQQQQQIKQEQPPIPESKGVTPNPGPQQQRPHPQEMGNNKGPGSMQQPSLPLLQTPPQGPPLVVAPGGGNSFPPGVLNGNWFYVRCQNFPLDISIAEIMQFFQGFWPIGESIRLHYSSDGRPTGNAVVGFNAAEDANRALQRLNVTYCRRNTVSLHPA